MIGTELYALTPRDRQQAQVETVFHDSGVQLLISITWRLSVRVPNNKIFVLQNMAGYGAGTGGQAVNGIFFLVAPPNAATTVFTRISGQTAIPAATPLVMDRQFGPGLIIQPSSLLQLAGDFTAGAVANELRLWLSGYFLPRGNIGQGSLE